MAVFGIRFSNGPRHHPFDWRGTPALATDSWVVVQSRRGLEIGQVRAQPGQVVGQPVGAVLRQASEGDLARWAELGEQAEELKWLLRARARERGMNLKIVGLEFTLDGAHITLSYSSDERVDLRTLAQDLAGHSKAQVHFHGIGPRDQARMLGTLGACGSENCSSHHLQDFTPVTIRMTRDQQLPLNPEKISGPCGRLLCCLQYEHDMYQEILAELPRKGSKVCSTVSGACGRVSRVLPMKGMVEVQTEEGQWFEAKASELRPA
jgi:cell fate regulator YaaT (PSP1 superfamily)